MNTELSDLGQSSKRPELVQCLQNGEAFIIHNKHMSDRFTVSILHEIEFTGLIADVQFSQNGRYIAVTYNSTAVIYDLGTGEKVVSFCHEGEAYYSSFICAMSFTSDAEHFLCALSTGNVTIWNMKSGADRTEELGLEEVGLAVFSRDGSILVWMEQGRIRIFDCEVGSGGMIRQRTVIREDFWKHMISISADNKLLVSLPSFPSSSIRVWDTETGTRITDIQNSRAVFCLAFSAAGHKLAVQEVSATITLRDLTDRESSQHWSKLPVHEFAESTRDFNNWNLVWSCDDKWVFSAVDDGCICLWRVEGEPQFIIWAHEPEDGIVSLEKPTLMT
jgi:WD40 repeat protein